MEAVPDQPGEWVAQCAIIYDKFHVTQHANKAVDEMRLTEFFRQGGDQRSLMKGRRWLLLTRWVNLSESKQQMVNQLFRLNRRVMTAYLLKESLERLWQQADELAAVEFLAN